MNKTDDGAPEGENKPEETMTPEEKQMMEQMGMAAGEAAAPQPAVVVSPVELPQVEVTTPVAVDTAGQDMNLKMIMDIPVDVHVEIGQTRLSIRDILRLGVGSVVELDRLAGQPADIIVNGKMIGSGDVVVVNETFGIRVTKLVGVQERIESL